MLTKLVLSKLADLIPARLRGGHTEKASYAMPSDDVIKALLITADRAHKRWYYYSHSKTEQSSLPNVANVERIMERAASTRDADALRAYARLPELCDPSIEYLIPLLREIHPNAPVNETVTSDHIAACRRIARLHSNGTSSGDRTALTTYILSNMEQADDVLKIAEQRHIVEVDHLKELLAAAANTPALGDGVL